MNIDSLTHGNPTQAIKVNTQELSVDEVKKESTTDSEKKANTINHSASLLNKETKFALDKATGILQSITTDKISDKIIRKMPTDEYIHMLHVMDDIISGSIKKET